MPTSMALFWAARVHWHGEFPRTLYHDMRILHAECDAPRTWLVEKLNVARAGRCIGPDESVRVDPLQVPVRDVAAVDHRPWVEVNAQRAPVRTIGPLSSFQDDDIPAKLHRAIEPHASGRRHIEGDGDFSWLDVVEPRNANRREVGREGEIPLTRLATARKIVLLGQRWRQLQVLNLGGTGPARGEVGLQA